MGRLTLRHFVRIEQAVRVKNTTGEEVETWLLFRECWAKVEPRTGREIFQSQQVQSLVTHIVTTRYLVGVRSEMRIKWGTRLFHVESVINPAERNRDMELLCVERT